MSEHEQREHNEVANGCQVTAPNYAEYKNRDAMIAGLTALALDVAQNWRTSDYPPDMQRQQHQFRHAHLHAVKALGKIAALIDHADHDRLKDDEAQALADELPKLIADLVRCAAKMAETAPLPVDFADAYLMRANQLANRWATYRASR